MKVHLVDGTFELFRAHFGAPSATSPDGQEVGATRGLMRSLAALVGEAGTTHIAVAFDHVVESFRNELFDGYKTGEGMEPELLAQFPLAERATRAMGLVTWPMVEFEADDALATAAARYAEDARVEQLRICSPDKDLCQCVRGEHVVCVDRMRRRVFDQAGVVQRLGVQPESVPDYLALVGDTADGIPGVARWGAKSTASVLKHYPHLDQIPDNALDWSVTVRGAKTLAKNLRDAREDALLYRRLASLRLDVGIEESLDDLRWRGPNPELDSFCAELGDARFANRLRSLF
ncbi:MAG: flap endonuclease [Deltaproteobacteria bacterium]|nr:flap endonuclease [Deltaproteobacteria bacterium]